MSNGKRDCTTCVFNYPNGKKKIPYCTLKRFPILNPDIGCSKQMTRLEFKNDVVRLTDEERIIAEETEKKNKFEI